MIEFSNVSKVYPNGVVGLDDVNLTIEQGEFVGIIGLSGAGKSTLLRTINRMHDITSGTLTVDGQEVKNLKGKQLWELAMIAKKRKTLAVCKDCHRKIHHP